jgi:hypothetical protein
MDVCDNCHYLSSLMQHKLVQEIDFSEFSLFHI